MVAPVARGASAEGAARRRARLRHARRPGLEPEQLAPAGVGPALLAAGVAPATPYDGRHTYASLLIHEGRSMAYVAAALGSSQAIIQKHYSHLFDEAQLGLRAPMIEAIAEARAAVFAAAGGTEMGHIAPVRVLRQATPEA
jgi:integrase